MEKYYLSLKTGFIKKYEEIRTFVCALGKQKVGGHFGGFPKTRLKHLIFQKLKYIQYTIIFMPTP